MNLEDVLSPPLTLFIICFIIIAVVIIVTELKFKKEKEKEKEPEKEGKKEPEPAWDFKGEEFIYFNFHTDLLRSNTSLSFEIYNRYLNTWESYVAPSFNELWRVERNAEAILTGEPNAKPRLNSQQLQEYFEKVNKCNCKPGTGNHIVKGIQHDPLKLFDEIDEPEFGICLTPHANQSLWKYYLDITYKDIAVSIETKWIHQKACIKCNTCLDEKYKLIKKFKDAIVQLKKESEDYDKVVEICKNPETMPDV